MSVGQRQKLSILLGLGHKPDVLILDEPVASLDPVARRQFLEQIIEVAADGNRSVVFSSHIVSDVERLANKIWILKDQRMYWQGDFDSLKDSIVRAARARDAAPCPTRSRFRTRSACSATAPRRRPSFKDWRAEMQDSTRRAARRGDRGRAAHARGHLPGAASMKADRAADLHVFHGHGAAALRSRRSASSRESAGSALLLYLPPLTGGSGNPSRFSLAHGGRRLLAPRRRHHLCFAFGASLLPTLLARFATSHYLYVLPYGRTKLLASAFATVALTALFAACIDHDVLLPDAVRARSRVPARARRLVRHGQLPVRRALAHGQERQHRFAGRGVRH